MGRRLHFAVLLAFCALAFAGCTEAGQVRAVVFARNTGSAGVTLSLEVYDPSGQLEWSSGTSLGAGATEPVEMGSFSARRGDYAFHATSGSLVRNETKYLNALTAKWTVTVAKNGISYAFTEP